MPDYINPAAQDEREPENKLDARMKKRDPHYHETMQRQDWPLLLILAVPALTLFGAGFALGRIWA